VKEEETFVIAQLSRVGCPVDCQVLLELSPQQRDQPDRQNPPDLVIKLAVSGMTELSDSFRSIWRL
jgi:hypothetical protein